MKRLIFLLLITTFLSSCSPIFKGKDYYVNYIAKTKKAKYGLWFWMMKNEIEIPRSGIIPCMMSDNWNSCATTILIKLRANLPFLSAGTFLALE